MAWTAAVSAKLGKIAAAWGVILDEDGQKSDACRANPGSDDSDAGGDSTRGSTVVDKAISRIVDASEVEILNVEVVVCAGKHPSLAVLSHRRNSTDAESEVRAHLQTLVWAKAAAAVQTQSHGGL